MCIDVTVFVSRGIWVVSFHFSIKTVHTALRMVTGEFLHLGEVKHQKIEQEAFAHFRFLSP